MAIAFKNFSNNAASCEREGKFTEAARFWAEASTRVNGINQEWAINRADFCNKMAQRETNNVAA